MLCRERATAGWGDLRPCLGLRLGLLWAEKKATEEEDVDSEVMEAGQEAGVSRGLKAGRRQLAPMTPHFQNCGSG